MLSIIPQTLTQDKQGTPWGACSTTYYQEKAYSGTCTPTSQTPVIGKASGKH